MNHEHLQARTGSVPTRRGFPFLPFIALIAAGSLMIFGQTWADEESTEARVTHKPKVFERLWKVYPNKEGHSEAVQAWNELHVSDQELNAMRVAFPRWKFSEPWMKDKGKHVPPLATWLRDRMWEQEPPPPAPQPPVRWSEVSSFLLQPLYLVPRLALAVSGAAVGGVIWPFDSATAKKVWDFSFDSPWLWHEFVDPRKD